MIKKMMFVMVSGLVLMFTSCGDQHKAQSLVKDFLDENLVDQDCSYERFSRLTPTAMISFDQMKVMRQNVSKLPYIKKNIDYNDAAYPDTLLYKAEESEQKMKEENMRQCAEKYEEFYGKKLQAASE